ncbi:unnamed protein product, partial [Ixodes pacificus]
GRGSSRGGGGHKGQRRHFTNLEELEREKQKEERTRQWKAQRGEGDDESGSEDGSSSEEESSEEDEKPKTAEGEGPSEEEQQKAKGVEHLIEVENPNRVEKKVKKVAQLDEKDLAEAPQLSRREREEVEKQKAKVHYQKMHAAGKTEEARADLARLALIRKQREEQARRRDE